MQEVKTAHPTTLPYEDRKHLNNVLIDAWLQAESREDEKVEMDIKRALDILGLPWVRLG